MVSNYSGVCKYEHQVITNKFRYNLVTDPGTKKAIL